MKTLSKRGNEYIETLLNVDTAPPLCYLIGVNSTAFGRKVTLGSATPFSRFSLKMSRFFAYFELEKMRSMRSAQRQVELRRLGNQLPVLGKANSLCKIVNLHVCFACL